MVRTILGVVLGIVAWVATVALITVVLASAMPAVDTALKVHSTAAAMAERLAISAVGSLIGGWLAATVGRSQRAALITGIVMLVIFVPYHLFGSDMQGKIWTSFPLWYHLTFFVSLPLLAILGGRLARR
ncbi:MAG: hypothetical protein JO167_14585 [Alphaproteobacteria bacterium]|nr:hypothetical protein [Alphaproteobacteria bacterium]MBV9542486.1 hypothetical protein [Alphaproteobacteria bacterium]